MIERTFYAVGHEAGNTRLMQLLGFRQVEIDEANFLIWPGGADINPALYDAKPHPRTGFRPMQDKYEVECWETAKAGSIKIGICRGAQLLNVMNGGTLYQDVNNHAVGKQHKVHYYPKIGTPVVFWVNSLHHQMMKPAKPAQVWGIAEESTYRDEEKQSQRKVSYVIDGPDVEVVWYPASRSLCFQAHPEYESPQTRDFFVRCLNRAIYEVDPVEYDPIINPNSLSSMAMHAEEIIDCRAF